MALDTSERDLVSWRPMTEERYAALEREGELKVLEQGAIFWRRVRPFFYRPLIPFRRYDLEATRQNFKKLAVFQHCVSYGQVSNSYLNFIVFHHLQNYDSANLNRQVQQNLRSGQRNGVTVRALMDESEFIDKAYEPYLSFYHRSKYRFASQRASRDGFAAWAHSMFEYPELMIAGAFQNKQLLGFEMSCRLDNIVVLKTVVHSDKGLELHSPDLILDFWRRSARADDEIALINAGGLSTPGIDQFKFRRGASILGMPAYLHIEAYLLNLISRVDREKYQRLVGFAGTEGAARDLQYQ